MGVQPRTKMYFQTGPSTVVFIHHLNESIIELTRVYAGIWKRQRRRGLRRFTYIKSKNDVADDKIISRTYEVIKIFTKCFTNLMKNNI